MEISIGTVINRFGQSPFSLNADRHTRIVSESGTGKSILIGDMAIRDIRAGRPVIVIDPHDELVERIADHIPKGRFEDVIWWDPLSDRPIGLPVLTGSTRAEKMRKADQLIDTASKIYGENSWGGQSAYIARNLLYAILEVEDRPTVAHLFKALMSESYREYLFALVTDENLRQFKKKFDEDWKSQQREMAAAPPTNKVDTFISNYVIRGVLCQAEGLNTLGAIQGNKVVLCALGKGRLGPTTTAFLGSLWMQEVLFAGLARPKERNHARVYVDEFHNFISNDAADFILSELRKYQVSLVAADQTTERIPKANFYSKVAGRVDSDSAEELAAELSVTSESILNLQNFKWYVKQGGGNTRYVEGAKPIKPIGNEHPSWKVKRHSFENYGTPRQEVEDVVNKFLAS